MIKAKNNGSIVIIIEKYCFQIRWYHGDSLYFVLNNGWNRVFWYILLNNWKSGNNNKGGAKDGRSKKKKSV